MLSWSSSSALSPSPSSCSLRPSSVDRRSTPPPSATAWSRCSTRAIWPSFAPRRPMTSATSSSTRAPCFTGRCSIASSSSRTATTSSRATTTTSSTPGTRRAASCSASSGCTSRRPATALSFIGKPQHSAALAGFAVLFLAFPRARRRRRKGKSVNGRKALHLHRPRHPAEDILTVALLAGMALAIAVGVHHPAEAHRAGSGRISAIRNVCLFGPGHQAERGVPRGLREHRGAALHPGHQDRHDQIRLPFRIAAPARGPRDDRALGALLVRFVELAPHVRALEGASF